MTRGDIAKAPDAAHYCVPATSCGRENRSANAAIGEFERIEGVRLGSVVEMADAPLHGRRNGQLLEEIFGERVGVMQYSIQDFLCAPATVRESGGCNW